MQLDIQKYKKIANEIEIISKEYVSNDSAMNYLIFCQNEKI